MSLIPIVLLQAKNPNKRAELQAQLVHVEQQLRNEAARRRKAEFEKDVKVCCQGLKASSVAALHGVQLRHG